MPGRREDLSRQRLTFALAFVVALALALAGCRRARGDCFELMDVQVCDGAVAVAAAGDPAPPRGWRCSGTGASRRCVDRAAGSGPWRCESSTCEERQPRQPDDGTWECADLDGAVVCHGGAPPAGVVAGPPDDGWICGDRRGVAPPAADRVCVDLSPDFPEGAARGWRCTFTHEHGERRLCRRDESAPAVGAPCDGDRECKPGDRCLDRRCVPPRPQPSCWIDRDCGAGARCRRGSCS